MKKLCIILALLFALSCLPAFAATGDVILGREEGNSVYFNRAFTDGETLYMVTYDNLYTWHVGDAAMKAYTYGLERNASEDVTIVPFLCDGQLLGIVLRTTYSDHTNFEDATLYDLTLGEDGTVGFEERRRVDWDDMVEYYDQDSYAAAPDSIIAADGKAYLRHYNSQYDYVVSALDLETGRTEEIDALNNAYDITVYKDGLLLVEQYTYQQSDVARLLTYDPASDDVELVADLSIEAYSPIAGLAYDPSTDAVYCVKGGEICPIDLDTGEVGAGVTDMPVEGYAATGVSCVLNGGYYALCNDGAVIRNLDPGQRAEIRLKICDSNYVEAVNRAYNRFTAGHPEVNLVLSRDYNEGRGLIENMMNRDDSVDIYTVYCSDARFDAVFKRGYMMELDGEAVDALAESMYPSLRECVSQDGAMVAVPVEIYCWTPGINEEALEKLGYTIADVPDNWWDFLDFVKSLEDPISENDKIRLFYNGTTVSDARSNLFYGVFECYQRYVNAVANDMGYDTPLLRGLIDKIDALDFLALGCDEDPDEGEDNYGRYSYNVDAEELVLFQTSVGCAIGGYNEGMTPIWMGLDADSKPPLLLETVVAFVNPFTRYPDQAREFMNALVEALPDAVRYNLDPSLSEPIRGAQNEQYLEEARQTLASAREELANAEPAEVQMMEEIVKSDEEMVDWYEKYGWDVSQSSVDWYRANADGARLTPVNWLYADESGEASELIMQYYQGTISLDEMLKGIDRKVQMMMLEGN